MDYRNGYTHRGYWDIVIREIHRKTKDLHTKDTMIYPRNTSLFAMFIIESPRVEIYVWW